MKPSVVTETSPRVNGAVLESFKAALRGQLLSPEDEGYDEVRQVWNGMIDRRPVLITRCSGASDVITAVNFARTHDLLVSVRGGGHSAAGNAVCDGGLMAVGDGRQPRFAATAWGFPATGAGWKLSSQETAWPNTCRSLRSSASSTLNLEEN